MENNQSMSMDQHFYREGSWKDVKGYDSMMQELGNYPASSVWGSGPSSPSAASQANGHHVDTVLYKNLVEMVPLVQSLMDCRANKSFCHQATLVYTPKPPRDSSKKMSERKGGKTQPARSATKQRAPKEGTVDNYKNNNVDSQDNFVHDMPSAPDTEYITDGNKVETLSSGKSAEILKLQNHIEELEKKLVEKEEELLKSAENSANQIEMMQLKVEELQQHIQEKDSLIKSAHLQLCHKKNELADVKSLLKKSEEDSRLSNQKVQNLEDALNGLRCQIAAFVSFFETFEEKSTINQKKGVESSENPDADPSFSTDDSHLNGYNKEQVEDEQEVVCSETDKKKMEDLEQAKRRYLEAVITAKNNPGEETLSLAADLRLQLQEFLLRPTLENILNDQLSEQALRMSAG